MAEHAGSGSERREAAVQRLQGLCRHLLGRASPGCARIALGPPRASYERMHDELQGYARPLWGMAALAQSGEGARLGAATWAAWRRGLINGTDPAHGEYWGLIGDRSQACCEAPAIALALRWAGPELWEPLTGRQRQQVLDWLSAMDRVAVHANNWLCFRIICRLVLQDLGVTIDRPGLEADVDTVCGFFAQGWANDGLPADSRTADWYVPMALGVYGLVIAELLRPHDAQRAARIQDCAGSLAAAKRLLTASDGAPVAWGRSLAYRRASAGYWAALAWADAAPLPWAETAWAWRAQMAWWDRFPGCGGDGGDAIGYRVANEAVAESYLAHSSPLWWTKSLLALRRPASHPFWAAAASEPASQAAMLLPAQGLLICGSRAEPLLLSVGQRPPPWMAGGAARYLRFAYGAHGGFLLPADDGRPSPDNDLLVDGGSGWQARTPLAWRVEANRLIQTWTVPGLVDGETILSTCADGYRREHHLLAHRPLRLCDGGHPLAGGDTRQGPDWAAVRAEACSSELHGDHPCQASFATAPPAQTLCGRACTVPLLLHELPAGPQQLLIQVYMTVQHSFT